MLADLARLRFASESSGSFSPFLMLDFSVNNCEVTTVLNSADDALRNHQILLSLLALLDISPVKIFKKKILI